MVAYTDAKTFVEIGAKQLTPFAAVASGRLTVKGESAAVMRASGLLGLDSGIPARAELSAAP